VAEVELLQGLAGGEPGRPDPAFAAVRFPGGDLPLQAGDQELLMRPRFGPARSASRPAASRRLGAFSARVRKATSAARSRPGAALAEAIT
jgi:hypothetical protein